jgi:pimeloyl-ACP methyl ester carboxylesterase
MAMNSSILIKVVVMMLVLVTSISVVANTGDKMKKRTIIFLHGGPGFKDYLKPYLSDLKNNFNCTFYDQKRGSKIKIDDLVLELDKLVESQSDKPILLGHSWGGVLATEYIKRFQNKVSGLILMSTGLNASQWGQWNKELDDLGLGDAPPEEIFLTSIELENGKKLLDETMNSFSGETFDSIFESYLKKYDLLSDLSNINVPILNIFGEKDLRFSRNVTKTFRSYNKSIVDIEIKNAGHFPFLEKGNRKNITSSIVKHLK